MLVRLLPPVHPLLQKKVNHLQRNKAQVPCFLPQWVLLLLLLLLPYHLRSLLSLEGQLNWHELYFLSWQRCR